MDWLILRDVLNTACNITSAAYKGVGGLTMSVDTADQAVCTLGHSSPDHTTRRADVEWNSLGPQTTPINAPQWPHRVCVSPAWLDRVSKKPSVKADLLISSNCVTVSGHAVLEYGYYNKQ